VGKFHILKATTINATHTKPRRVKLESLLLGQSIIIPYGDYSYRIGAVQNWCLNNGFNIIGTEDGDNHTYLITDTIKDLQ
jgi:hypothetical protein